MYEHTGNISSETACTYIYKILRYHLNVRARDIPISKYTACLFKNSLKLKNRIYKTMKFFYENLKFNNPLVF